MRILYLTCTPVVRKCQAYRKNLENPGKLAPCPGKKFRVVGRYAIGLCGDRSSLCGDTHRTTTITLAARKPLRVNKLFEALKLICIIYTVLMQNRSFFTRKQTCNGEYTKHCTRSRHQLKMAAPAEVSEKRSNFRLKQF